MISPLNLPFLNASARLSLPAEPLFVALLLAASLANIAEARAVIMIKAFFIVGPLFILF